MGMSKVILECEGSKLCNSVSQEDVADSRYNCIEI